MRHFTWFLLAVSWLVAPLSAQYCSPPAADGISATGIANLSPRPDTLVMTIQIEGRSSDLEQAAKELERRLKVAQDKLNQLGSISTATEIAKPTVQGEGSPEEAERMQMLMQQYGGGDRGRKMLEQTQSVSLVQSITARWQLPGDKDLDRLVETKKLTDRIRAADIASTSDPQPVSAAQAELAEEMEAMMEEYSYGEETTKIGEPVFRFVAKVSAQQYRDAIATAFHLAKREIATVVAATETNVLEPLPTKVTIASQSEPDYYGNVSDLSVQPIGDSGDYEVSADGPLEASCVVTVTAVAKHQR